MNVLGKLQLLGVQTVKVLQGLVKDISGLRLRDLNAFFEGIEASDHFLHDPYIKKVAQGFGELTAGVEKAIRDAFERPDKRDFVNNYCGLVKNVAKTQVVDSAFFERQALFIKEMIKSNYFASFHPKAVPALL